MSDSILIFDSGVGGLSILTEVRKALPGVHIRYLMDSEMFPYGIRADGLLAERIVSVCKAAVSSFSPSMLVLACNTASTLALSQLREALELPVVGVVPAIRVAGEQCRRTDNLCFGLLATPATVSRSYTQALIDDFASDCRIERLGCSELVDLAEQHIAGVDTRAALHGLIGNWLAQHPDMRHVVLGCTHFPLLRDELELLWPEIHWIDSGAAVARQSARVFRGIADEDTSLSCNWTGTQEPEAVKRFLSQLGPLKDAGRLLV